MTTTTQAAVTDDRVAEIDRWGIALSGRQGALDVEVGEWLLAVRENAVHQRMGSGASPSTSSAGSGSHRTRRRSGTAEQYALWREVVRVMRRDVDARLTEEECLQRLAREGLGGPGDDGRAPYQIAVVRCEDCGRAWQGARGEPVELTPEGAERVLCDAHDIGPVDASSHVGRSGKRASQTIPPAVRRQVMYRDRGRCRVPGCKSSTFLDVHHIRPRSEAGGHDPSNLLALCEAHHHRLHGGLLIVEGDATTAAFMHADGTPYGGNADAAEVGTMARAFSALRNMGWKETETKRALATVRSHVGRDGTDVEIVRAALLVLSEGIGATA